MKKRILFVCLGNICRSPAAEGVLQKLIEKNKLNEKIEVDSAGTGAWHVGEPADPRMQRAAERRGYQLNSLARQFSAERDFYQFDYIITMDESNYDNVVNADSSRQNHSKVHKMVSFCRYHTINEVPDPYLGGDEGFEHVLDILEDGCEQLLKTIQSN